MVVSSPRGCVLVVAALLIASGGSARAGLAGQPKPPASVVAVIQQAARDILGTGDLGNARPALFLAVENNALADLTDYLAAVVRDDTAYNGLAATLEEAASKPREGATAVADRSFAQYNFARLNLLRARVLRGTPDRTVVLRPAIVVAKKMAEGNARDLAAVELLGDLLAENGQVDEAAAAYRRIAQTGTPTASPYMYLKIATAFQRANRLDLAMQAYETGVRADASGGSPGRELLHRLYQGTASVALQRGNDQAALLALSESARRVKQDESAPFRLRLDVAQQLLARGHARNVLAYAEAALRLAPSDENAKTLRDQARARLPRR